MFRVTGWHVVILSLFVVAVLLGSGVSPTQVLTRSNAPVATTDAGHPAVANESLLNALAANAPDVSAALAGLTPQGRATISAALSDVLAGHTEQGFLLVDPALGVSGFLWGLAGFAPFFIAGCLVGAIVGDGVGCLIGAAVVAVILVVVYIYGLLTGTGNNPDYGKAEAQFRSIYGQLHSYFDNGTQSLNTSTINSVQGLNLSIGSFQYDAADAALSQLGNATFNAPLDWQQSGIAAQLNTVTYATEYAMGDDILTALQGMNVAFGGSNGYAAEGLICGLAVKAGYDSANNATNQFVGGTPIAAPHSITGSGGGDGVCNTGGTSAVSNGTDYPATIIPVGVTNVSYYLPTNFAFLAPTSLGGGYTGIILQFAPSWAPSKEYNLTFPVGAGLNATFYNASRVLGGAGVYSLKVLYECDEVGGGAHNCANAPSTNAKVPLGIAVAGVGVLPFLNTTFTGGLGSYNQELSESTYLATVEANTSIGGVIAACGYASSSTNVYQTNAASSIAYPLRPTAGGINNFTTCPTGLAPLLTSLSTLSDIATTTAKAYWAFLRGQGWTSLSQVPPQCLIPPVESIFPPDYSLATLAALTPSQIQGLYTVYLAALAKDYGVGLNGTSAFCGTHVTSPTNISLNNFQIVAIGKLFIPPNGSQTFLTPSTWTEKNVSIAIAPSTGNLTIPTGKIWEAPAANPSVVYYGRWTTQNLAAGYVGSQYNLTGIINATTAPTIFMVAPALLGHFTGNSTLPNGSVFPTSHSAAFGTGGAIDLSACWKNVSGVWTNESTCKYAPLVINWQVSNNSCVFFGSCASIGSFAPPSPCIWGLNWLSALWSQVPFLGAFACLLAVLTIIAIVVIIVIAIIRREKD